MYCTKLETAIKLLHWEGDMRKALLKYKFFILFLSLMLGFCFVGVPCYAVQGLNVNSAQQDSDPGNQNIRSIARPGSEKQQAYKEEELLVKFKEGISEKNKLDMHKRRRATRIKEFRHLRIEHVQLDPGISVKEALAQYKSDPDVEYAVPNYIRKMLATPPQTFPNDALFNQLWGLNNTGQNGGTPGADIKAPAAWNITTGGDVVVAVIDTGIDYTHQDLAAQLWVNLSETGGNTVDDDANGYVDDVYGINAITGTGDPWDDAGHGTHVAGTLGAASNNSIGVAGVAWNVKIVACKFLGANGTGTDSDAITCLEYVRALKARGVNIVATSNSWGGGDYSQALYDAIAAQLQNSILFVAAAGNDAKDTDLSPNYPSSFDLLNIMSVAATDNTDKRASFSNYGSHTVHVAAPGKNIMSTLPAINTWGLTGGYGQLSGTSMATPHVTGLTALLLSKNPSWTVNQVLAQIAGTADSTGDPLIGAGRINCYRALTETLFAVRLLPLNHTIEDAAGNNDGRIDAGETINLSVRLKNMAASAQGVYVTLSSADPYVTITNGTFYYGDMGPWSEADNTASPYVVTISPDAPKMHKITFSLSITANNGTYTVSESFDERISFYLPGWPVPVSGSDVENHPVLADIDHDGLPEVIIASDKVYVVKGDGSALPGWPQAPGGWMSPAAADIDNDGRIEIVQSAITRIYAWKDDGTLLPGFPVIPQLTLPFFGQVSLADIDSDGKMEILVAEQDSGRVYAIRSDGSYLPGWPVSTGDTIHSYYAVPSVADIDGDGYPEVVIGTMGKHVYAWRHDGSLVPGWPVTTPEEMVFAATIGDVNNDGAMEIFVGSNYYMLYAFNSNGTTLSGWPQSGSAAALGDINKDGYLEIVTGFRAYRFDGTMVPGWRPAADPYWTPSLADIDNDGNVEIITRNTVNEIYAFRSDGSSLPEFPLKLASRPGVESSVALGDINGDGSLDMITGSNGPNINAIQLPVAASGSTVWPMYQHDAQHTGSVQTLWFVTRSLHHGKVGTFYSDTLQAAGGEPPYAWSVAAGSLPDGLSLNPATGVISGTSYSVGTSVVTFQVMDSRSHTTVKVFPVAIDEPLAITTAALAPAALNSAYSQTLTATGGATPYHWTVISGSLPAGLTLGTTGIISGTPTAGGFFNLTVQVTDASSNQSSQQLSLNVRYVISSAVMGSGGSISPSGTIFMDSGSSQTFTFTPNTGYHIDTIRVDGTPIGKPTTYTFDSVQANHTIWSYFDKNYYALTVTKSGSGSGTVSSSPSGINCGTSCTTYNYYGTTYTLTATPSADSVFSGWSACPGTGTCTVMLDEPKTVTAIFTKKNYYTLTVTKAGSGSGSVTSSPAGINCGASCSSYNYSGTTYTLTATPDADSVFSGWSGACSGTGTCTVSLYDNTTVTANFTKALSVTAPNGGERWSRNGTYTISWSYDNSTACSGVKIELLKSGSLNRTITSSAFCGNTGSGSYSWRIPTNQAKGSDYTIRVTSTSNSSYTDISNSNFTIQ